eukprot:g1564.t1
MNHPDDERGHRKGKLLPSVRIKRPDSRRVVWAKLDVQRKQRAVRSHGDAVLSPRRPPKSARKVSGQSARLQAKRVVVEGERGTSVVEARAEARAVEGRYVTDGIVAEMLAGWDRGGKSNRRQLLRAFVRRCENSSSSQVEKMLQKDGSLLLSRIMTWLRLTYFDAFELALQLRSLSFFLGASCGAGFLPEFIEAGGIVVLLEILKMASPPARESDKVEALRIIKIVGSSGRAHMEVLCECEVVGAISQTLRDTFESAIAEECRNLLVELGSAGNPRYSHEVLHHIIQLMRSQGNPLAQRLAAQTAKTLMSSSSPYAAERVSRGKAVLACLPSALAMLRCADIVVQYEGMEILKLLVSEDNLAPAIFVGLRDYLRLPSVSNEGEGGDGPGGEEGREEDADAVKKASATEDSTALGDSAQMRLACHGLQSAAVRTVCGIVEMTSLSTKDYSRLAQSCIDSGVLPALVVIMFQDVNLDARESALRGARSLVKASKQAHSYIRGLMDDVWDLLEDPSSSIGDADIPEEYAKHLFIASCAEVAKVHPSWSASYTLSKPEEELLRLSIAAKRNFEAHVKERKERAKEAIREKKMKKKRSHHHQQGKPAEQGMGRRERTGTDDGEDDPYRTMMIDMIKSSINPEVLERDFSKQANEAWEAQRRGRRLKL